MTTIEQRLAALPISPTERAEALAYIAAGQAIADAFRAAVRLVVRIEQAATGLPALR